MYVLESREGHRGGAAFRRGGAVEWKKKAGARRFRRQLLQPARPNRLAYLSVRLRLVQGCFQRKTSSKGKKNVPTLTPRTSFAVTLKVLSLLGKCKNQTPIPASLKQLLAYYLGVERSMETKSSEGKYTIKKSSTTASLLFCLLLVLLVCGCEKACTRLYQTQQKIRQQAARGTHDDLTRQNTSFNWGSLSYLCAQHKYMS